MSNVLAPHISNWHLLTDFTERTAIVQWQLLNPVSLILLPPLDVLLLDRKNSAIILDKFKPISEVQGNCKERQKKGAKGM